jgi:phospholipid transport system substrate-binding protein
MKLLVRVSLLLVIFFASFYSTAEQVSAFDVVSQAGEKLFSRIKAEQNAIKDDPALLELIVEQELMPSVDHRYSAFKILGKHILKASKTQRELFSTAMRQHLVKTYASALKQYNNQQVVFHKPKKSSGKIMVVTAMIQADARPDINVDFKMRKNKQQQWKAFDMVVEGISLLTTKQAEITKRIRVQGIDKTTLELNH